MPGRVLLRFYGERTLLWARKDGIERGALTERHISQLWAWGRAHRKCRLPPLHKHCALLALQPVTGCVHRCT